MLYTRLRILCVTALMTAMPALAAEAGPRPSPFRRAAAIRPTLTIPAGTELCVRLAETLDTRRVSVGDPFSATLDAPVIVHGRVVVPKGTVFRGHVTAAKASGRFHGEAVLGLALDSFGLRGATYRVQTFSEYETGGGHKKRTAALIGGGAGFGAALGAVTGVGAAIGAGAGAAAGTTTAFITGKRNVKLPAETPVVFSLSSDAGVRG